MEGLWLLSAVLACWLGCTLYRAFRELKRGRAGPEGTVYLLMGNQAGVAEWFLRGVCRCGGILAGRLEVAVEAGGEDDTAGIARIMTRQKGLLLAAPGEGPGGAGQPGRVWVFDVREAGTVDLLKIHLNVMAAL